MYEINLFFNSVQIRMFFEILHAVDLRWEEGERWEEKRPRGLGDKRPREEDEEKEREI